MKRKLIFHGSLKKLWPAGYLELDADTVAEAVSGMCRVTNGAFNPVPGRGRHEIVVQGYETVESLSLPLGDEVTELHLAPAMRGGKRGGFVQIAIGVVLIAAAFAFPQASMAGTIGLGSAEVGSFATAAFWGGASMLAGGLLAMLSPAPRTDMPNMSNSRDPEASKYLGAPKNTVRIGTRIPIIAGRVKTGFHILSMNIDARDVSARSEMGTTSCKLLWHDIAFLSGQRRGKPMRALIVVSGFAILVGCALPEQRAAERRQLANVHEALQEAQIDAQIKCSNKSECDKAWQLAKVYVHQTADMKVQFSDDTSISTYNSIHDQVALKATKIPGNGDAATIKLWAFCRQYSADYLPDYRIYCGWRMQDALINFRPFVERGLN